MKAISREHNGVNYENIVIAEGIEGSLAAGKTKQIIEGRFGISEIQGAYDYPEQVQLQIYSEGTAEIKERNKSEYSRLEIFFDKEDHLRAIKELALSLWEIYREAAGLDKSLSDFAPDQLESSQTREKARGGSYL